MTTRTRTSKTEAKSRSIQPVRSVWDFQKYDQILIKSGESVTRKVVRDINLEGNSVTATDAQGQNEETIMLNPTSPARDGDTFKYWIDEGKRTMPKPAVTEDDDVLGMDDPAFDDEDDGMGLDVDLDMDEEEDRDDTDADMAPENAIDDQNESDDGDEDDAPFAQGDDDDEDDANESFAIDMRNFLGEEDAPDQVPDNTVGGGVDDSEMSDNDGEDTEDTPAPHDTTGMEDAGDVETMAGDRSSNGAGAAPEDEIETHGDVGGPETIDNTLPDNGEHEPGTPDKSESISESVRFDVKTALSLVKRGADPAMLAPRLLRGEAG